MAEHGFLVFLFFLVLSLILGGFLFYQYSVIIKSCSSETDIKFIKFKENVYQEILEERKKRDQRIEQRNQKQYPNLFK